MNNKLPAYFEKYFEQKFGEVAKDFADLKSHVNDEMQLLRQAIQELKTNQFRLVMFTGVVAFLFVFHDFLQGSVLSWLLKALGV